MLGLYHSQKAHTEREMQSASIRYSNNNLIYLNQLYSQHTHKHYFSYSQSDLFNAKCCFSYHIFQSYRIIHFLHFQSYFISSLFSIFFDELTRFFLSYLNSHFHPALFTRFLSFILFLSVCWAFSVTDKFTFDLTIYHHFAAIKSGK